MESVLRKRVSKVNRLEFWNSTAGGKIFSFSNPVKATKREEGGGLWGIWAGVDSLLMTHGCGDDCLLMIISKEVVFTEKKIS